MDAAHDALRAELLALAETELIQAKRRWIAQAMNLATPATMPHEEVAVTWQRALEAYYALDLRDTDLLRTHGWDYRAAMAALGVPAEYAESKCREITELAALYRAGEMETT